MHGITYVNLRNRQNVIENLSLAVLKEMVGIETQWYCILRSFNLDIESLLLLALHYLPKEKFCIYPEEEALSGSFLRTPWVNIGKNLCSQPTISIETFVAYLEQKREENTQR